MRFPGVQASLAGPMAGRALLLSPPVVLAAQLPAAGEPLAGVDLVLWLAVAALMIGISLGLAMWLLISGVRSIARAAAAGPATESAAPARSATDGPRSAEVRRTLGEEAIRLAFGLLCAWLAYMLLHLVLSRLLT